MRPSLSPLPCPYRDHTVFYRDRDRYRTVLVGSAKRTEPLIVTVRFLVFDREPYRTKMGTIIRLLLRIANRCAIRTALKLVRYGSRCVPYQTNLQRLSIHRTNFVAVPQTVPHQFWCGTDRGAVRGPQ